MILKPNDVIQFGKHKGFKLSEVYRFSPSYLEWAIKYLSNFILDIEEFQNLPKPTPYVHKVLITFNKVEVTGMSPSESDIPHAYKALENGEIIKEEDYKFPNSIIEINKLKLNGDYKLPHYPSMNERIFKFDNIKD